MPTFASLSIPAVAVASGHEVSYAAAFQKRSRGRGGIEAAAVTP